MSDFWRGWAIGFGGAVLGQFLAAITIAVWRAFKTASQAAPRPLLHPVQPASLRPHQPRT